jgi:hypothetical protein
METSPSLEEQMRLSSALVLVVCLLPCSLWAQEKKAPEQKVSAAVQKAVQFLRLSQKEDGSWMAIKGGFKGLNNGATALAVVALFEAGVQPSHASVSKGLRFLETIKPDSVYGRSLQTLAFLEACRRETDPALKEQRRERIEDNVRWLLEARLKRGKDEFRGWSYQDRPVVADSSNTHFAVQALWAAHKAGIAIDKEVWRDIRDLHIRQQRKDGSWPYSADSPTSLTMTIACLGGLIIADSEIGVASIRAEATTKRGWQRLEDHFVLDNPGNNFYHFFGLSCLGRATGKATFGKHHWYDDGCAWLIERQQKDGAWKGAAPWDQWPEVNTSFALIFLCHK